jgi:hypothetical protein
LAILVFALAALVDFAATFFFAAAFRLPAAEAFFRGAFLADALAPALLEPLRFAVFFADLVAFFLTAT